MLEYCERCKDLLVRFRTDEESVRKAREGVIVHRIYTCDSCGTERIIPVLIPENCTGALLEKVSSLS